MWEEYKILGETKTAPAQFSIPSIFNPNGMWPLGGFNTVPFFNFDPEGFKPFMTIDSKYSYLVPCQIGIQLFFIKLKLLGNKLEEKSNFLATTSFFFWLKLN